MIDAAPYHLGVVVNDLEQTMRRYSAMLGLEHWATEHATITTEYKGRLQQVEQAFAYAPWGQAYLELVQPISGASPATDFLRQRGEGAYHVGYFLDDLTEHVLPNSPIVRRVWIGDDLRAVYYDTLTDLGLYVEAVASSRQAEFTRWVQSAARVAKESEPT